MLILFLQCIHFIFNWKKILDTLQNYFQQIIILKIWVTLKHPANIAVVVIFLANIICFSCFSWCITSYINQYLVHIVWINYWFESINCNLQSFRSVHYSPFFLLIIVSQLFISVVVCKTFEIRVLEYSSTNSVLVNVFLISCNLSGRKKIFIVKNSKK